MASTPSFFSRGTSALAVSTSSRNSMPRMPDWVTMLAVPSRVMPMKPTFTVPFAAGTWAIQYGGKMGRPLSVLTTFAAV